MEWTDVVIAQNGEGEVQLFSDDQKAGEMHISIRDSKLTVYHTEVLPEHEGKGFAGLLLKQLVSYARANKLHILPMCPYVHLMFRRHPQEYQDVWYPNEG